MRGVFKIKKILFPAKSRSVGTGEYAIFSCTLVDDCKNEFKKNSYGNYSIKGQSVKFNINEDSDVEFTFDLQETADSKYPDTYEIKNMFTSYNLETTENQKIFLSKFMSKSQIESLYSHSEDIFTHIQNGNVSELVKVKGIGESRATAIIEKCDRNRDYSPLYTLLEEIGVVVTPNMGRKLIEQYKSAENVVLKITENPYVLANDMYGIGFSYADSVALDMGHPKDSIFRVTSFMEYFMNDRAENGYSWVTPDDLLTNMVLILGEESRPIFGAALHDLHDKNRVVWDDEQSYVALRYYYDLEKKIAQELIRIRDAKPFDFTEKNKEEIIGKMQSLQGWEFSDEQLIALDMALKENLCMITGFGGSGKTSSVGVMLKILEDHSFAQTALSGKASSRLQEVTNEEGFTIHRLLEYDPTENAFRKNKDDQLSYDIIILDEGSMVGGELFLSLVESIKSGKKLIILGDEGQLESIGSLSVFKDMLDSGKIPVVRFKKIHRQAMISAIATESLKVYKGEFFMERGWVGTEIRGELQDLKLDIYDNKLYTAIKIINNFKIAYSMYGNVKDINIVVPSRFIGDASAYNINLEIQELVNPKTVYTKETLVNIRDKGRSYPHIFREGDRVLNKKNNRELDTELGGTVDVFNGFLGTIMEIHDKYMIIDFDLTGRVIFDKQYYHNLLFGYAITGHSMQGSENKCVIVGFDFSSYSSLSKEWVYTAITRAKSLCCIVAETQALTFAISTSYVPYKQTFLQGFLKNGGGDLY